MKINLLNLTPTDAAAALAAFFATREEPSYRVSQVLRHLWGQPVESFAEMTALPAALRVALGEHFDIPRLALVTRQRSQDGTEKFLFQLHDGQTIETVAIPEGRRLTLCISSQAGCAC